MKENKKKTSAIKTTVLVNEVNDTLKQENSCPDDSKTLKKMEDVNVNPFADKIEKETAKDEIIIESDSEILPGTNELSAGDSEETDSNKTDSVKTDNSESNTKYEELVNNKLKALDDFRLLSQQFKALYKDAKLILCEYQHKIIQPADDLLYSDAYNLSLFYEYIAIPKNIKAKEWKEKIFSKIEETLQKTESGDEKRSPSLFLAFKENFPELVGVSEDPLGIVFDTENTTSDAIRNALSVSSSRLRIYMRLLKKNFQEFNTFFFNFIDAYRMFDAEHITHSAAITGADEGKTEELLKDAEEIVQNNYSVLETLGEKYNALDKDFRKAISNLLKISNQLLESENTLVMEAKNNPSLSEEDAGYIIQWAQIFRLMHGFIINYATEKLNVQEIEINIGDNFSTHIRYSEVLEAIDDPAKESATIIAVNEKGYKRMLPDGTENILVKPLLTVTKR